MLYYRLTNKNPRLNDAKRWYRCVDDSHPDWFFATIWGTEGMISSVIHAVPKEEYDVHLVTEKGKKDKKEVDGDEFF